MKKTTTLAIIFIGLNFASCKKDRTCECTTTQTNTSSGGQVYFIGPADATTTSSTVYKKIKKSDMKSLCRDNKYANVSTSNNPDGTTTTVTQITDAKCSLK